MSKITTRLGRYWKVLLGLVVMVGILYWMLTFTPEPFTADTTASNGGSIGKVFMAIIIIVTIIIVARLVIRKTNRSLLPHLQHPLRGVGTKKLGAGVKVTLKLAAMVALAIGVILYADRIIGYLWYLGETSSLQNTGIARSFNYLMPGSASWLLPTLIFIGALALIVYLLQINGPTKGAYGPKRAGYLAILFWVVLLGGGVFLIYQVGSGISQTASGAVERLDRVIGFQQTPTVRDAQRATLVERPTPNNQVLGEMTEVLFPGAYSAKYVTGAGNGYVYKAIDPATGERVAALDVFILDSRGNWVDEDVFYASGQTDAGKVMFKNVTDRNVKLVYERTRLGH